MKKAVVFVDGVEAGELWELDRGKRYDFFYRKEYRGLPVSLTMPTSKREYHFDHFPPFFEGLLPEGMMLEGLLRLRKLDRSDLMGQLIAVGHDMVGNVTVEVLK